MKPQSVGRFIGVGLRVAGRMAGQRLAASANAPASNPAQQPDVVSAERRREAGKAAGQVTRGVARGVGGFLRPFGRVGGILWLEVTGVFFFLPVVVFAPNLWRIRSDWAQGPNHKMFLITAGVVALFLYLSVTSFLRARRK